MVATSGARAAASLVPEVRYLSLSYLLGAILVLGLVVAPIVYMFVRCVQVVYACA